ncbi:methionyl-tRNA formyltransferase, mitochondrial [Diachasma alloeum]|uniref:methionyl-tRNA formyltransferase, mitochondrial n=1 Tax=Diachasma alloeum TaxID=454923 RepID=UPI000738486A|nr:methionyl-tRNA formyltransferase, mitochondrial [Diachasma alloeum]
MVRSQFLKNSWNIASFSSNLFKNQQWPRHFCCLTSGILQEQSESSNNVRWKVLFFGTDEFGLESLKRLDREYRSNRLLARLEAVIAYKGEENAVIKYAKDHGIKVHHWPIQNHLDDFDIGLVASFGHLIPSRVIKSFPLGMINVHASLLPRWRGAAPIVYALINGDSVTGVTIMKIAPKKFDVGEILEQRELKIHDHETQPELHKRLANTGGDLLIETLEKLPDVINSGRPQSNEKVTYAPKIQKSISIVKWAELTAREVYNLQRALTGIFPLKTTFQGKSLKIFGVKLPCKLPRDVYDLKSNPGMVVYDKQDRLLMVQCKNDSWVTIEEILMPGKRKMSAVDFNNGFIKNRWDKVIYFGAEQDLTVNKSTVGIKN